jgi:hypothetical protein
MVTYLQGVITVEIGDFRREWRAEGGKDLIISSTLREGCTDPYTGLMHFMERIRDLTPDQLKQLCCRHYWEHTEDCSYCSWRKPDETAKHE